MDFKFSKDQNVLFKDHHQLTDALEVAWANFSGQTEFKKKIN